MTNREIARALRETADLIELTGGNRYRARAMQSAARTVARLQEPIAERAEAGTLTEIDGIGQGLASHIEELLARGSFEQRDDLLNAVPTGLLDVLRVKGLGTTKVRRLWEELGITSLDDLEAAAEGGRLVSLDGFGAKTQENVLKNVRLLKRYSARRRYADALLKARDVLAVLRATDAVERAELTGALRRKLETVPRVALLVAADDPAPVRTALSNWLDEDQPPAADLLQGQFPDGFPLQIRIVPSQRFGTAWWESTGSEQHCRRFRERYGAVPTTAEEAEIYEDASLSPIPPELREDLGEFEAAERHALPSLITTDDLRGALHNHSTYSDGADTLRAMAEATRAMGLSYLGICDHSQSLSIASGLSPQEVARQQDEIRDLNAEFAVDDAPPFRIFSGIESDILADGSLDYDESVLASFDFVVASVHSGFNMTEEEATERIIRAVANPYTSILGHATGRLLLVREGYTINHERVIEACAEHNVAIELNANPYRLDMDWRFLRLATEHGVLISINPDAHSTEELAHMRWGVAVARKAWLTAENCLNAKSLEDFTAWIESQQSTHA